MNEMRKLMEAIRLIEEDTTPIKVIMTAAWDATPDDDEYWQEGPDFKFDVYYGDTKIGDLATNPNGEFTGRLGNRVVDLENPWGEMPDEFLDQSDHYYVEGPKNEENKKFWVRYVTWLLNRYFTEFEKGRKHLELIKRQLGIE